MGLPVPRPLPSGGSVRPCPPPGCPRRGFLPMFPAWRGTWAIFCARAITVAARTAADGARACPRLPAAYAPTRRLRRKDAGRRCPRRPVNSIRVCSPLVDIPQKIGYNNRDKTATGWEMRWHSSHIVRSLKMCERVLIFFVIKEAYICSGNSVRRAVILQKGKRERDTP